MVKECTNDVTIIIVNWNSGAYLNKCINHLNRQSVRPNKIYIVDNASSDRSLDTLPKGKNICIKRLEKNYGFAEANNRAIQECNTKYVALLNPDAFPADKWLESLIRAAEENPGVAAFGSRQVVYNSSKILDGVGDECHISGLVWRKKYLQKQSSEDFKIQEIFSPCAAASLYRTDALKLVGGFDSEFFCYIEDVDLGFRLRLMGYKCLYIPNALVEHVGSVASGKGSDFYVYQGQRNLIWNYIKNMPGILFWLFLPLHLTLNIFSIFWFIPKGQGRVVIKSKLDALRTLPYLWQKRKTIQAMRVVGISEIWRVLGKQLFVRR